MAEAISYKCLACGGPLEFTPGAEQIVCEYCGSAFTIAEIEAFYAQQVAEEEAKAVEEAVAAQNAADYRQAGGWDTSTAGTGWAEGEAEYLHTAVCSSCGAEIVSDANTMATECCYCGNATMLPQRFTGMLRPDYVIPFQTTKEDAIAALTNFAKGKRLLPDSFIRDRRFEKIQGMYVPFWLFSADVYAEGQFDCTKVHSYSEGDYHVTETSHYRCVRAAGARFYNVPADGSLKMNDTYMESVEPFDYSQMVPFSMAYMAGYLADKYDVDAEANMPRADARIAKTMLDSMTSDLSGEYDSVTEENHSLTKNASDVKYALAPVWILSTRYNNKIYTFMMNGQTGKFVGTLPSDEGKQLKYMLLTAAVFLVLGYFVSGIHFYAPFVLLAIAVIAFGGYFMSYRKFVKDARERGDNL